MAQSGNMQTGTSRDPNSALHDVKEKGVEQFNKMADKATDQFNQVASSVENVAHRVADQGREASERMQEVAGNMQTALNRSMRDQPMATLAVAAAVGFVLGALWKS